MSAAIDTLQLGASIREAIAEKREKIETLNADMDELASGYLPAIEAGQRFNNQLDSMAARFNGEYLLDPFLRADGKPADNSIFRVDTRPGVYSHTTDLGPMLAFLFGDQLKTRIAEYVETLDCPDGPLLADRPALIKKLKAKILAIEIKEEQLICEAEQNGIEVSRHPDASPAVVLEWRE